MHIIANTIKYEKTPDPDSRLSIYEQYNVMKCINREYVSVFYVYILDKFEKYGKIRIYYKFMCSPSVLKNIVK
jgi:hypothetical protein